MTRLLVIEDQLALREELVDRLQLEGYEIISAGDGAEGLQVARDTYPDAIICDIMLPQMNGYEVLQELRKDSITAAIPFIFLTAKVEEMRVGMELGADDYITKPFHFSDLLNAIRTRIDKRHQQETQYVTQLVQSLLLIQDAEHRRSAHQLDQDIARPLKSLRMLFGLSKNNSANLMTEAQHVLDTLIERLDAMILNLWPAVLDHLGLLPALLWLFDQFTSKTQVQVHLQQRGLDSIIPPEIKMCTYQIVRDAIYNVAHHAETNEVFVTIWIEDDRLACQIEDRGKGFSLDTVLNEGACLGLIGMRERAVLNRGQLTITSAPSAGTTISIWLPLNVSPKPVTKPLIEHNASPLSRKPTTDARPPNQITILLADEDPLVRQGLHNLLADEPLFTVTGETGTADNIGDMVRTLKPDVLILDLLIPKGLDTIRHIADSVHILVLSSRTEDIYAWEALQRGATGCILKKSCPDHLVTAVRAVAVNQRYLGPELSVHAADAYIQARTQQVDSLDAYHTLTEREKEVLQLVVQGYKNTEIADNLFISVRTAETHRANLMRKLGLHDKSDLLRYAIKRGLTSLE